MTIRLSIECGDTLVSREIDVELDSIWWLERLVTEFWTAATELHDRLRGRSEEGSDDV